MKEMQLFFEVWNSWQIHSSKGVVGFTLLCDVASLSWKWCGWAHWMCVGWCWWFYLGGDSEVSGVRDSLSVSNEGLLCSQLFMLKPPATLWSEGVLCFLLKIEQPFATICKLYVWGVLGVFIGLLILYQNRLINEIWVGMRVRSGCQWDSLLFNFCAMQGSWQWGRVLGSMGKRVANFYWK